MQQTLPFACQFFYLILIFQYGTICVTVTTFLYNEIFFSFHNFNHANKNNPKYRYDRADQTAFIFNVIIFPAIILGDINRAVRLVTKNIMKAEKIIIPKSTGCSRKYYRPQWNDECQPAKKKQKKAWGSFRKYPTTSNYTAYKQARAYVRNI